MNRIDRLSAILIQLQSKSRIQIHELEEKFELSRRTIFRDIRSLLDAGVPIGGDAGDGYFITEGYHLPPVVFNRQEASALLIGGKLLEQNADAKIVESFTDALTKLKAVLKYSDRDFLENIESKITVLPSPRNSQGGFPDSHLAEIQYAISVHKTVQFQYFSNYSQEFTEREARPLGLVYYAGRWHLIAYCLLREDLRDFRMDRLQKLKITPNEFDPASHPEYMSFMDRMLQGTDAKHATVHFEKRVLRFISDQKYHYGFIEQTEVEGGYELKFATPDYDFFARWLLAFGKAVKVINPPVLQDLMKKLTKELYEHYK